MIKSILFLLSIMILCSFIQAKKMKGTCFLYDTSGNISLIFSDSGVFDTSFKLLGYYRDDKVFDSSKNEIASCSWEYFGVGGSELTGKLCSISNSSTSFFVDSEGTVYDGETKEVVNYKSDGGCQGNNSFQAAVVLTILK